MADFSISQFKQYVQTFINATGIDDGNGVIESKNGELSKVLSNFGLEESQIGDLLEKSDNSTNDARRVSSTSQPYPKDIHKDFIEASKRYEELPESSYNPEILTKKHVRTMTAINAIDSYNKMTDSLMKQITKPLYNELTGLPNDNTIDGNELKAKVTQAVVIFAQRQHDNMVEMINQYDTAFSEYDITYRSPFELKQSSGVISQPNMNNIADACMSQVMAKLDEYLSKDTTSLTFKEHLELAKILFADVNSLVQEKANYIETVGDNIAECYKNDFEESIEILQSDNPTYEKWMPPLDGLPHEEEPDHIAIKGAPIEKTFTDVVNSSATTDITSVRTDSKKAPVYDLSGKQVTGDLQKGQIYIQNGKKFVAQ